jgi:dihydropteroate synthase
MFLRVRFDEKMFATLAELQVPYIMMHMQGSPETMQQNPSYD